MIRYPVERTPYCKTVGQIRVDNIAEILKELGFQVKTKQPECHDVDIWVYTGYTLVLVIEVLNWKRSCYLGLKRTIAIRDNLSNNDYANSRKLLIFSFWENVRNQLKYLQELDIDFLEIGFQTQPVPYFIWFVNQGQASGMRDNYSITKHLVRRKLVAYLRKTNLI